MPVNPLDETKQIPALPLQSATKFQPNPTASGLASLMLLAFYRFGSRCCFYGSAYHLAVLKDYALHWTSAARESVFNTQFTGLTKPPTCSVQQLTTGMPTIIGCCSTLVISVFLPLAKALFPARSLQGSPESLP
jgi:hypothetical protein